MRLENPFRVGGTIEGRFITGRSDDIQRIARSLVVREPLLVIGRARAGVTAVLAAAHARVHATGTVAMMANVETCSVPTDLAVRLLQSLFAALGRDGPDALRRIAAKMQRRINIEEDEQGGESRVFLNPRLREEPQSEQIDTLLATLDAIASEAATAGRNFAIILDDAHALDSLLDMAGTRELRAHIAEDERLFYVFGWREDLADGLFERFRRDGFAPIKLASLGSETIARWVDARLEAGGVRPNGAGRRVYDISGPRTGDLVRHARALFEVSGTTSAVRDGDLERAFAATIDEQAHTIRDAWSRLTAAQQNVLRAIAAGTRQLTGREARVTFGLTTSAAVSQSSRALIDKGWLIQRGDAYQFDSPFTRGWITENCLSDVGLFATELRTREKA